MPWAVSKGTFCFITSNSWLDVGYGRDLQEFLLKHSQVKLILDNQAKRSFSRADVNTVIVVLGAADDKHQAGLSKIARFVMFKTPFEEVLSPVIFEEIEETKGITNRLEFRCFAKNQRELYEEGLEIPDERQEEELSRYRAKYTGNKWGGKYLRAPDIFFTVLEKGKGKLVRLGDIAEVRFGIKTGANEFFYLEPLNHRPVCPLCKVVHEEALTAEEERVYLKEGKPLPAGSLIAVKNGAGWEGYLESEFLRPVIKSPREVKTINIEFKNLKYRILMVPNSIRKVIKKALEINNEPGLIMKLEGQFLKETGCSHVFDYVKYGESCGYNKRSTCSSRRVWWDLGNRRMSKVNCNYLIDDRMRFYFADGGVYVSDNFQELRNSNKIIAAVISVPLTQIFCEFNGRQSFGGGLLKVQTYEVSEVFITNPSVFSLLKQDWLLIVFNQMANREIKSIFEELGLPKPNQDYSNINPAEVALDKVMPDRRELDKIVFEVLELTKEEQLAVYRSVIELVKNRLVKARSV